MKKYSLQRKELGIFPSLLIGIMIAALTPVLVGLAVALALTLLENPTPQIPTATLITLLISAALTGAFTARVKGKGGFAVALFTILIASAIMLIITLIACHGKVEGRAFMNQLCYILVGALFAYFARVREKTHTHKRR